MARRKKHVEAVMQDRWLVSYADFITLLFAFFVVMFATSETNKVKARKLSESVEKAFGHNVSVVAPPKQSTSPSGDSQFADLAPSLRLLQKQLDKELSSGKMRMSLEARGLVITLGEAAFFPPGEDRVEPSAFDSLAKVASALEKLPNPIRLEGHSDSRPIHSARFSSNWELSTARAVQVLKTLEERYRLNRYRLSAAGFADTSPVSQNDTEKGRMRNRRVDLVVLSRTGSSNDPVPQKSLP